MSVSQDRMRAENGRFVKVKILISDKTVATTQKSTILSNVSRMPLLIILSFSAIKKLFIYQL